MHTIYDVLTFWIYTCINLPYFDVESDLIEYFKEHGVVVDAIVMRDRHTNKGRGFGFVKMRFETFDQA